MDLIGEHCNNTPCEWLLDLGKGGAHDTSAHHLFDGMPSQPEMPKEDRRISEPVPINTTVNKEEKWLNEALDRILEKFEQMEVKRRCDEKIDRILENLDEIEANRNKFCEEMSASIKATTAALTAASYLPLQEPPSPTPTTCSMRCSNTDHLRATSGSSHIDKETAPSVVTEVGDSKDKDHAPCIVTKDLPKITPARCSTLDLDVNTDIYHAVVVFPLMDSPLELITGFIEPSPVVELKLDSIIGMKKEVPNGCSMKCLKDDNMLLMENPKRNPWPPPWLDGVIRGRDLRPSPWPGFISGGTVEHLVPPWPPPTQISCLALVCYDNGMIFTEMKYINLHWGELKPWPPPNQSDFRHTMVQFEQCQSWKIGVIIGLLAWKKQLSSVNHGSYTTIGNSRMPKLTMEKRSYMLNASDGNGTFWPMGYWQCTSLPIRHIGNYVLHWLSVYMTWPQLRTGRVCSNETKMKMLIYGIHELYKNRCGMIPREGNMHEQGYGYYYLLLVKLFALKIGKQTRFGVLQELKHSLLVLFTQDLGDDEVGQHIILLDCLNLMHCFQLRNNWWLESLSSKPVKLLYELWSLWVSSICVVENKDDFIQLAGHQFTPYMMAQYIEAIEHGLIDGNGWDANNVHDTYGCKERMSVTVILKDGTDIWKLKGIKKSAIKNIISVWKSAFTPAIKSLSQGNKPFCIYKPNVSNCLPCPVAVSTIPGKLKMRNTIVMLVGHYEYYGEGENTKLQLKIVLAGKSNGIRNDLITLIIRVLQVPWDPGGLYFQNFTRHRLEDKSDFKERGLLGSQLEWAFGLMLH